MGFAEQLRKYRELKGLTQNELSIMIGRSKGVISNYENHVSLPKIEDIIKIVEVLEVEPNQLFWDDLAEKMKADIKEEVQLKTEEKMLIKDYRSLSSQGKEYIRQQMYMAKNIYQEQTDLPDLEDRVKGA